MDYKGYQILAEVNVNTQCEFEIGEDDEILSLTPVDEGGVDSDNLADFIIYSPDDEDIGYADTLEQARKIIDDEINSITTGVKHNV